MATNNFYTMAKFDLWVMDTESFDKFDFEFDFNYAVEVMEKEIEEINENLLFHEISVKDGYYTGLQFYVEAMHELDKYDYDNEDCYYYFDMCKSAAYRKYQAEINKINRELKRIGKHLGMMQLEKLGSFSNGEAIYKIV